LRTGADLLAAVWAGKFPLVLRYRVAGDGPCRLARELAAGERKALAVVFLELVWNVDFFVRLASGNSLIGLSAYMFDPKIPLFIRGFSCFHILLPIVLIWTLYRLGYDRRAWLWQILATAVVLPLSYLFSNPRENVNWVYGFGEKPQIIMPGPLFVIVLMVAFPIVIYLPMHFLFGRIFGSDNP